MPADAPRKPVSFAWPAVAVVIVVLLAIIGWLLFRTAGTPATTGSSPSTSPSPGATAPDTAKPVPGVNGCLGGEDASVAIYAAMKAPLTKAGAVSFAATAERWAALWPKPAGQMDQMGPKMFSAEIVKRMKNATTLEGTKRWGDTRGSVYKVEAFDHGKATVAITVAGVGNHNGRQVSTTNATVFQLTVEDGHWFVASARGAGKAGETAQQSIASLEASATPLPRGCG